MARVRGPFLSLEASGGIGTVLAAARLRRNRLMRLKPELDQDPTAAQTSNRADMTAAVNAWRNYLTLINQELGWNNYAKHIRSKGTGYHECISSLMQRIPVDPDASYAYYAGPQINLFVRFDMYNVDDGAVGDEAGLFDMYWGPTIDSMTLWPTPSTISAGSVYYQIGDPARPYIWIQCWKDGVPRSGMNYVQPGPAPP